MKLVEFIFEISIMGDPGLIVIEKLSYATPVMTVDLQLFSSCTVTASIQRNDDSVAENTHSGTAFCCGCFPPNVEQMFCLSLHIVQICKDSVASN